MDIQFIDNVSITLEGVLLSMLPEARKVRVAVAFVKYSGIRLLQPALNQCLEQNGQIEFIIGLDFRTTDAESLRALLSLAKQTPKFHLLCFSDPGDKVQSYHPKLYLLDRPKSVVGIIGSSNLTQGGLRSNVEVNVALEFRPDDDKLEPLRDMYSRLKYQPTRFTPDDEYIDAYADLTQRIERVSSRKAYADANVSKALSTLREKEQQLPGPFASPVKLTAWQKMVYAKLPDEEFATTDLYQYADEFRNVFPQNRFIEAKTRQVLQQLRDLGVIIHAGQNRWIKHPDYAP